MLMIKQTQQALTTGAAVVDGGVGIAKNLNVGQNVKRWW